MFCLKKIEFVPQVCWQVFSWTLLASACPFFDLIQPQNAPHVSKLKFLNINQKSQAIEASFVTTGHNNAYK